MIKPSRTLAILGLSIGLVTGCAGGGPSSPPPSMPAMTPSAAPAAAPATLGDADIGRALDAGTYGIAAPFAAPFSIAVPAGWSLSSLGQGVVYLDGPPGSDAPWLYIGLPANVFADPCHSQGGPMDPPVAPTVDGIVGALGQMVGFKTGPVTDVVVGAHTGKAFDLTNTVDTQSAECYQVDWLPMWTNVGGEEAATIGGWREQMWVLDVEGTPVIVDRGGHDVDEVATTLEFATPLAVLPTPIPSATPSGPQLTYVALGDSLLFAAEEDCDGCTSAAVIYGQQLEEALGTPVEVHNLTMHNSLDSAGLRRYLEKGAKIGRIAEDTFAAVASADIVSVTIGFNDFGYPAPATAVTPFAANLDAILGRIRDLRADKATTILVTQIYNNGGASWTPIVEAQNNVICDLAAKHDATCVDIYHPFNGPDGSGSPAAQGYLGADRDPPKPARHGGHRRGHGGGPVGHARAFDPAAHGRPGNEGGAE